MAGSGGGAGRGGSCDDTDRKCERERALELRGGVRTRCCAAGERRSLLTGDRLPCRGDGGGDRSPDLVRVVYKTSADVKLLALSDEVDVLSSGAKNEALPTSASASPERLPVSWLNIGRLGLETEKLLLRRSFVLGASLFIISCICLCDSGVPERVLRCIRGTDDDRFAACLRLRPRSSTSSV